MGNAIILLFGIIQQIFGLGSPAEKVIELLQLSIALKTKKFSKHNKHLNSGMHNERLNTKEARIDFITIYHQNTNMISEISVAQSQP